jgi:hypothetical protein
MIGGAVRQRLSASLVVVAVLTAGSLTLFGRGGTGPSAPAQRPVLVAMPACPDAAVTFRLTTDSPVYLPGQPVRVNLEVRNTGSLWCRIAGQCDEVAPLSIFDGGRMLWSDRPCYNHEWDAVDIPLAPDRPVTSQGSWNPGRVRGGWYEARAAFLKVAFLVL